MITVLGHHHLACAIRANLERVVSEVDDDLIWVAYDTPLNADGSANIDAVLFMTRSLITEAKPGTRVLLSSQLRVGTCTGLEHEFPYLKFAVHPENNRAAHAAEDFATQERAVVGIRNRDEERFYAQLFQPFAKRVIFMSPESAEMVKHGLNGFLALSITYANELADVCTRNGADPADVAAAIMADPRVGEKAYIKPGPKMGPHLAREVHNLKLLGGGPLIHSIGA